MHLDLGGLKFTVDDAAVRAARSALQLLRDSAVAIAVNRGLMDPPVEAAASMAAACASVSGTVSSKRGSGGGPDPAGLSLRRVTCRSRGGRLAAITSPSAGRVT